MPRHNAPTRPDNIAFQDTYVCPMTPEFALDWEAMRCDLWPEGCADHAPEISAFFNQSITEPIAVLIARILPDCVVGFAELSLRYDIAGLAGKKTGYVEGLYVDPAVRNQGVARRLVSACRQWARDSGCMAFASDRSERLIIDRRF